MMLIRDSHCCRYQSQRLKTWLRWKFNCRFQTCLVHDCSLAVSYHFWPVLSKGQRSWRQPICCRFLRSSPRSQCPPFQMISHLGSMSNVDLGFWSGDVNRSNWFAWYKFSCIWPSVQTTRLKPEHSAAGTKVEICAGDAKVSCALRQCGLVGKEFDVSWQTMFGSALGKWHAHHPYNSKYSSL